MGIETIDKTKNTKREKIITITGAAFEEEKENNYHDNETYESENW
tara:strand:+ start:115 stop:249 length:135 start_codon:yes stop_codon:yes gene_type:complete